MEGSTTKVYQPYLTITKNFAEIQRWNIAVRKKIVLVTDQKNILGLEISVHQPEVMKERHTGEQLFREVLYLCAGKWGELIVLQKVKD